VQLRVLDCCWDLGVLPSSCQDRLIPSDAYRACNICIPPEQRDLSKGPTARLPLLLFSFSSGSRLVFLKDRTGLPPTVPPSWYSATQRARRASSGPHDTLPPVVPQYMTCGNLPAPDTGANLTSLSTLHGIIINSLHGCNPLTTWSSLTWSWDKDRNNLGRYWWFGVTGILNGA